MNLEQEREPYIKPAKYQENQIVKVDVGYGRIETVNFYPSTGEYNYAIDRLAFLPPPGKHAWYKEEEIIKSVDMEEIRDLEELLYGVLDLFFYRFDEDDLEFITEALINNEKSLYPEIKDKIINETVLGVRSE